MKTIILFLLMSFSVVAQLPYEWNGNPYWTSSQPSINTLNYQTSIGAVSTSGFTTTWQKYNNNQNTSYTSPAYNFTCGSSVMRITVDLMINLEPNYDFLHLEYSLNGSTWLLLETYNQYTGLKTYTLPNASNIRFRFRFVSDGSINDYCSKRNWIGSCTETSIYYADVLGFKVDCSSYLPIELITFDGNCDGFKWSTASEKNNDYFEIEKTLDGKEWETIARINGNSTKSTRSDYTNDISLDGLSYYRLSQTDLNGTKTYFDAISIECNNPKESIYFDMMGKQVNPDNVSSGIYLKVTGKTVEKVKL